MTRQLPLDLKLHPRSSFENFLPGTNHEALSALRDVAAGLGTQHLLLCGGSGSGKTHLLEAVVRTATAGGLRPLYLPLDQADHLAPDLLDDLEQECDLICVDDVQNVAGRPEWERALFALQVRSGTCVWVTSSTAPPGLLGFAMPELATRLSAGLVYPLHALRDGDKHELLQHRARALGLELEPAVARYLLERHARDLAGLMRLLDRIDAESLRRQRRPTIAFIRGLEVQEIDP
ncbi:MAG: DnaA regulatory inactivator Hda [Acidiferrobacteraceae bacterium]